MLHSSLAEGEEIEPFPESAVYQPIILWHQFKYTE